MVRIFFYTGLYISLMNLIFFSIQPLILYLLGAGFYNFLKIY